jgi:glycosyltransferase involved in cell wall biosynthesis
VVRILHILATPRAEGTPRLALDWLSVDGYEQAVLFLDPKPADLVGEFRKSGRPVALGDALVRGPAKFFRMIRLVRRQALVFRPDVVIAWPVGYSPWIFLGVRASGNQALLLSHCGNPPKTGWPRGLLLTWLCAWTTALFRGRMITCSRYIQRLFLQVPLVPRSAVGFAYNCVRTDTVTERARASRALPAKRPFRALMVATLEAHKDHATLIRAARIVQDRGVNMEIILAGDGSLRPALQALTSELGVDRTVTFLGARPDIPELLGQSDVFVLSTTPDEGRPGVILEALAAGLPIIASDVEPLRELLDNGRWGTLVPAGDPAALAAELLAVAQAGSPDEPWAAAARSYASGFSPERMIADYLEQGRRAGTEAKANMERADPVGAGAHRK